MDASLTDNPTAYYANWAATTPSDWPQPAVDLAVRCIIDIVACSVAGVEEESSRNFSSFAAKWSDGPCTIIGTDQTTSPMLAALANGTIAHALDFDDNHSPSRTHASAALFPVLLALGVTEKLRYRDIVDAFIVSIEVLTRIGHAMNPLHKNLGWQGTSTIGVLGIASPNIIFEIRFELS